MRKVYRESFEGQSPDAWGNSWSTFNIEEEYQNILLENDYHLYEFNKIIRPGYKIFEGGCGIGQFVYYYWKKGFDISGIDFSSQTINEIKQRYPNLPVKEGNILDIDFPSDYFDIYYSGGVVEHFEEGPEKALKEAFRILHKEGLLLITVPYNNVFRRLKDYILLIYSKIKFKNEIFFKHRYGLDYDTYKLVKNMKKDKHQNFHMYSFSKKEFSIILKKNNFNIIATRGMSILFGLRDLRIVDAYILRKNNQNPIIKDPDSYKPNNENVIYKLLKKYLQREETDSILSYFIVKFLGMLCGNLRLYICRPIK